MEYRFLLASTRGRVGLVRFNRPDKLNALSPEVIAELAAALEAFDADDQVGAMVVTGDDRAFAAGADIGAMASDTVVDQLRKDMFATWDRIRRLSKPVVAAVSGWALGGGCETAMMCDLIVASETARFGQPEINIGVMPGAGGTQRLAQAVGKARAMELVLTGRTFTAAEALAWGLVNRVLPVEAYLDEAVALAEEIAAKPPVAVRLAKQAVNAVFDDYLDHGLLTERRNFYLLFATEDQREGMAAFLEKRPPAWTGR